MVAVKLKESWLESWFAAHPHWYTIDYVSRMHGVGYSCARLNCNKLVARGLLETRIVQDGKARRKEYRWIR